LGSELTLTNVHFRYNNTWCLEGIDFEAKKGEIVGIIGPNGSGKSTLLKVMDGLLRVQKGEILLRDKSIYSLKRNQIARHIAMDGRMNQTENHGTASTSKPMATPIKGNVGIKCRGPAELAPPQ
jgi:ABC-type cobalamin/Fe3+-siderophores transport system ATPase subunit